MADTITDLQYLAQGVQPVNLGSDEGNAYFARQAFFLAAREAQRGAPDNARVQLATAHAKYVDKIADATIRDGVETDYQRVVAFVASLAPQSAQLARETAVADANYVAGQELTAGQKAAAQADNADTQAALDAKAAGKNPDAVYAASTVQHAVAGAVSDARTVAGGALAGIWDGLGWVKWLGAGLAFLLIGGALWLYATEAEALAAAAKTVTGGGEGKK